MRLSEELRRLAAAVSRSFALSLRALPGAVRDPVALAYMLARASDTIADAEGLAGDAERLRALGGLAEAAAALAWPEGARAGAAEPGGAVSALSAVRFAERLPEGGERELLRRLPELLALAARLPQGWRCELAGVLGRIIEGQRGDVTAFPRGGAGFRSLPDEAALERYTYLVAGCVGGFWTRVCLGALPGYARVSPRRLVEEGVRFGQGLQLVNILRDRPEDLAKGRCYIPLGDAVSGQGGEVSAAGGVAGPSGPSVEAVVAASGPWFGKARRYLEAGARYAAGIRGARARFAVLLPARLGERTLDLVEAAGAEALRRRVKAPRAEVRRLAFSALLRAVWPL